MRVIVLCFSFLWCGPLALSQQDSALQAARVRVSEAVLQAFIVRKVLPVYPKDALERGVDGVVTISVLIDQHGVVEKTWDADGDPLLATAVADAVKQWQFKPYYLNKQPVQVESQISISFELKENRGIVRYWADEKTTERSDTVDQKNGNLHLQIPILAAAKPKRSSRRSVSEQTAFPCRSGLV
jgi:TonB family protein